MKKSLNSNGGAVVEFALVLPILVLILFGIVEFGLLLFNKQVITNASREGARAGIVQKVPRLTTTDIENVINNYAQAHLITFASAKPAPSTTVPNVCSTFGQDLSVTVTYPYQFLTLSNLMRFMGSGTNTITLTAQTTMKCE